MYILVLHNALSKKVFKVIKYFNLDTARNFYNTMVEWDCLAALYDISDSKEQPRLLLTNMEVE